MGKGYKIISATLISLIVTGFFFTIHITVDERMPRNAVVVVTLEDKLYHSIHFDHICVTGKTAKTMTLSEAVGKGYRTHLYCQDLGYFVGNRRFLFHHILSKLGMPMNSRWDRNGDWLW